MNDTIHVTQLLRQLKISRDSSLFNVLFLMYVQRYRQVLGNTTRRENLQEQPD